MRIRNNFKHVIFIICKRYWVNSMIISCSTCQKEEKNAFRLSIWFTLFYRNFKFVVFMRFFRQIFIPQISEFTKKTFFPSLGSWGCSTNTSVTNWLSEYFVKICSTNLHSHTVRARMLTLWEKVLLPPPVTCQEWHVRCHMSPVTCHMSHVMCHMSHVMCHIFLINFFYV